MSPRRSALYLPASNLRAIEKARSLPCDVVILDLEDAVAPEAKASARDQAVKAVLDGGFDHRELIVRVNGLDTEWGEADVYAAASAKPAALLIPKVSSAADVLRVRARLGKASGIDLWAMIETALSFFRLEEIAQALRPSGTACFVVGTNDLAKELGARPGPRREPLVGLLSLSVAAARAYGLGIFDGVFNAIDDDAGFEAECRQGADFGFDGKTLIHPRQIDPCNRIFTPDAEAVAWAQRIVAAFDDPANADRGVLRIDGRMVERLHLAEAQRTIAKAGG